MLFVVGDGDGGAADAALGGAGVVALGVEGDGGVHAGAAFVVAGVAAAIAHTSANAHALGVVVGVVVEVADAEGGGGEGVFAIVDGGFGGADDAAFEGGAAEGRDVETAIACHEAALFIYAGVVAVDFALVDADASTAGAAGEGDGGACAEVFLFACVGAGVLQAFDVELAANVGVDGVAFGSCADEVGVAAGFEIEGLSGVDMGVGPGGVGAVGVATALGGVGGNAETGAGADDHANACAAAAAVADLVSGVVVGQEIDLVVGG